MDYNIFDCDPYHNQMPVNSLEPALGSTVARFQSHLKFTRLARFAELRSSNAPTQLNRKLVFPSFCFSKYKLGTNAWKACKWKNSSACGIRPVCCGRPQTQLAIVIICNCAPKIPPDSLTAERTSCDHERHKIKLRWRVWAYNLISACFLLDKFHFQLVWVDWTDNEEIYNVVVFADEERGAIGEGENIVKQTITKAFASFVKEERTQQVKTKSLATFQASPIKKSPRDFVSDYFRLFLRPFIIARSTDKTAMRSLTNGGVELCGVDVNRISSLFFFSGSRMANIFNLLLVRMYGMLCATFRWCNMKHIELFIGDVEWMNGAVVKIYDSHRRR